MTVKELGNKEVTIMYIYKTKLKECLTKQELKDLAFEYNSIENDKEKVALDKRIETLYTNQYRYEHDYDDFVVTIK